MQATETTQAENSLNEKTAGQNAAQSSGWSEPRTIRIGTRITLLQPLSHGGEGTGTNRQVLNRHKFMQADGTDDEVPVISGNSIRGLLRDLANDVLIELLGRPKLSPACINFLYSGGSLTKGADSSTLNIQQARKLRELLPTVSLFGGGTGNQIHEGKLIVGRAVPLCAETKDWLPDGALSHHSAPLKSIYEHLEELGHTRTDDLKKERIKELVAPRQMESPAGGQITLSGTEEADAAVEARDKPQQMRFYTEVLATGTVFYHELTALNVTEIEYAALVAALWALHRTPYLGGKKSNGFGQVRLEHQQWAELLPPARALKQLLSGENYAQLSAPNFQSAIELATNEQDAKSQSAQIPHWAKAYGDFVNENRAKMLETLQSV